MTGAIGGAAIGIFIAAIIIFVFAAFNWMLDKFNEGMAIAFLLLVSFACIGALIGAGILK